MIQLPREFGRTSVTREDGVVLPLRQIRGPGSDPTFRPTTNAQKTNGLPTISQHPQLAIAEMMKSRYSPPKEDIFRLEEEVEKRERDKLKKIPAGKGGQANANKEEKVAGAEEDEDEKAKDANKTELIANSAPIIKLQYGAERSVASSVLRDFFKAEAKNNFSSPKLKSPRLMIKVIVQFVLSGNGNSSNLIQVEVVKTTKIEEFIKKVLDQWNEENRKPGLNNDPSLFELRMVDDDDDVDDDIPALKRDSDILTINVNIVALCIPQSTPFALATTKKEKLIEHPSINSSQDNKVALRISIMVDQSKTQSGVFKESYILYFPKTASLTQILGQVAAKKKVVYDAKDYQFFYKDGTLPLDLQITAEELISQELELREKAAIPEYKPSASVPRPEDFYFSKEAAAKPAEYQVLKYNRFGKKQDRTMRIEETKIHNLPPKVRRQVASSVIEPSMFSLAATESLRSSAVPGTIVKKKTRDMSNVIKAEVASGRLFQIVFHDVEQNVINTYKYEAQNAKEAAEIVARIEFLRQQH